MFNERPGSGQVIGSLIIIGGVTLVTFGRKRQKPVCNSS